MQASRYRRLRSVDEQDERAGHVFISYVRENRRAVNRLQKALEARGIRVWRDTADLWPGEDWRQKIETAIVNDTLVFIACFSRQSNAREVSYQNEELTLAIDQLRLRRPGKPWLIPVRFDNCEIPDFLIGAGRTLASLQRIDLFGRRLPESTNRLVAMVLRILGRQPGELGTIDITPALDPPPVVEELTSRDDSIVTFYSYKGGTGRTMALANIAWILAANGRRVLVADWDLESPGLYKFFQPFLDTDISQRPGIVDLIRRYAWAAVEAEIDPADPKKGRQDVAKLIDMHIEDIKRYVLPLIWEFPYGGAVEFLSPGREFPDYQATLSAMDWDNFYDNLYGALFFDALRLYFKREWDYVLIDSRAGLSDIADICTIHLPDIVMDCFTLSAQAVDGAAMIAEAIQSHSERSIRILPVPMRIDDSQKERFDASLTAAIRKFRALPAGMSEEQRHDYWRSVGVPYRGVYSYEEMLAVFGDYPGSKGSLLYSFERITGYISNGAVTGLPPMDEELRMGTKLLFPGSDKNV
jgi:MinD-like ATPase involved in chromosome partitioning or flagellar assembly